MKNILFIILIITLLVIVALIYHFFNKVELHSILNKNKLPILDIKEEYLKDSDNSNLNDNKIYLLSNEYASGKDRLEIVRGGVSICGRILDQEGKPIDGAQIEEGIVDKFKWPAPNYPCWNNTGLATSEGGYFNIVIPHHKKPLTFLRFLHPEYIPKQVSLNKAIPILDKSYVLEDIYLSSAYFIYGKVVDSKGKPISKCTVSAPAKPWDRIANTREISEKYNHDKVITNEEGHFQLKIRNNHLMQVTAYHDIIGIGCSHKIVPGQGRNIPKIKIILQKCLSITGKLVNADGTAVVGMTLVADSQSKDIKLYRETITDVKGEFTFPPLPLLFYEIKVPWVSKPNKYDANKLNNTNICYSIIAEGVKAGTHNLLLYLPLESKVIIHLNDFNGNPITTEPRVSFRTGGPREVYFYGWSGNLKIIKPGTFEYNNISQGTYSISISLDGYSSHCFKNVIVPPPPSTVDISAVLRTSRSITGKVYHVDGTPAQGVAVVKEFSTKITMRNKMWAFFNKEGIRSRQSKDISGEVIVTDENGLFRFDDVYIGYYFICIRVGSNEVYRIQSILVNDENPCVELTIELPNISGSIEGSILDCRGDPIERACVVAWDGDDLFNVTRSGKHGRYSFTNLPDGKYLVDAKVLSKCTDMLSNDSSSKWVGGISSPVRESYSEGGFSFDIDKKNAFNAIISNGETYILNLKISDAWNSCVNGRIINKSRPLPKYVSVIIEEYDERMNRRGRKWWWPSATDLFKYNTDFKDLDNRLEFYRFEGLREGFYSVTVEWFDEWKDMRDNKRKLSSEPFYLYTSSTYSFNVSLSMATIAGVIVDKLTGEPVSNSKIILKPTSDKDNRNTIEIYSRADGSFEGKNIPIGIYKLIIRCTASISFLENQHSKYLPFIIEKYEIMSNVDMLYLKYELESL